jgi:hypothetical protein
MYDEEPDREHDVVAFFHFEVERIVKEAEKRGVIITVSQRSLQPLAMRHYETIVEARAKQ